MKVFGLTGGIASGKSTVADMFAELGAVVIDADMIARMVVEPGRKAYAEIRKAFGNEILLPDGRLDRRKLRKIVFADSKKRLLLDSLVHPEVMRETAIKLNQAENDGASIVIYEAALLVETGLYSGFDGLIVVKCEPEKQVLRIKLRDQVTSEEADNALASQSSTAEKLKLADYVIDNSHSLEYTQRQVKNLWERLQITGEDENGTAKT